MSEVQAVYRIATHLPLEAAAESIVGEQSTGTFIRLAGETDALRDRYRARVVSVEDHGPVDSPALPGTVDSANGRPLTSGIVRVAFPLDNTGASIPRVLAVTAGNLFELGELGGVKLVDLELPSEFADAYPGPGFGVTGTRRLVGRPEGVMLGTIVKPNIGLAPENYYDIVLALGMAGIDVIKDDEVNADCPPAPVAARLPHIVRALDEVEHAIGRRPLYAVNISDEPDFMFRLHDLVRDGGGNCIMVNINLVGTPAVASLRRHSELPIHGHMAGIGMLNRHNDIGMSYTVVQKLARLAGVDQVHVGGFNGKFYASNDETEQNVRDVLSPLLGGMHALPVISSAQWAGTAPVTWERTASEDLLVMAGGGMLGHPDGIAAGVVSMRKAWEATVAGVHLDDAATDSPELAAALKFYTAAGR